MERRTKTLEDELNAKQAELSGLRTTVAEMTAASAGLEAKFKSTQMQLDSAREKVSRLYLNLKQASNCCFVKINFLILYRLQNSKSLVQTKQKKSAFTKKSNGLSRLNEDNCTTPFKS